MRIAIEEAKNSSESLPCGAVIVDELGKVIAKAGNSARKIHDASAHAEINALRQASSKIKNKELRGSHGTPVRRGRTK